MKNFLLILTFILTSELTFAQVAVNTTGASADPSAILDVASTTKGLLLPRMSTAQRTGILSPAIGLMVFDLNTNSNWVFNGSWTNMALGSGFTLPYSANVNLANPLFTLENSGAGDVFYISSMGAGVGLNSFSVGGNSINTNSVNGSGIRAASVNNYPIVGLSDNLANTLAAIRGFNIGGGAGLHGSSVADNGIFGTSSANGKSGVRGEGTGTNSSGVYGNSNASSGAGVIGNNSSTGDGVYGQSTTGFGVRGLTNSSTGFAGVHGTNNGSAGSGVVGISNNVNTQGVYGSSTNGIGIRGFSDNFRAISGISANGSALYGSSSNGYALETAGNVKIAGGNTNPSNGAVLTSDANGNAVWKKNKIAFKSNTINIPYHIVPDNTDWKLLFSNELYDYSNNFEPYTSGTPTATAGTFTAPVNGLYHFEIIAHFQASALNDLEESHLILRKQQGNTINNIGYSEGQMVYHWSLVDHARLQLSTDVQLQSGDKIWVIIWNDQDLDGNGIIGDREFSGHLVFED